MDLSRSNPPKENWPAEEEDARRKIPSPKPFGSKAKKRKKPTVAGARVIRSAGGKDRHSKVCTAMGTKDRRVRLSPRTAIQFYDVQDRLGYDRPSKAIDWLMSEARTAIDALNLPPPPPANITSTHNCPDDGFGFENPHPPENFCFYMNGESEFQVYNSGVGFAWNYGNSPPPAQFPAEPPPVLSHDQISQREPLQSSFSRIPNNIPIMSDRFPCVEYGDEDCPFLHYEE